MFIVYDNLLTQLMSTIIVSPSTYQTGTKRVTGIGPATQAWEACVLPLNYTRITKTIISF